MTKDELVAIVHERTAAPRRMKFEVSDLNDLIKDGLVSASVRRGNVGLKPVWHFNWRDVHRVTFIVALQSCGVVRRDAQRLRLFIAGCRLPTSEVRQALLQEYRRAIAELNGQTRTAYLDNRKPITPAKLASITREIGRADPLLQAAGLEVPPEAMIQIIRDARQKPLPNAMGDIPPDLVTRLASGNASIADLAMTAGNTFAGMFQVDGGPDDDPGAMDSVDGLITNAGEAALKNVPAQFRAMARLLHANGLWGLIPPEGGPAGVRSTIIRTIKRSPPFLALHLVLALRMAVANPEIASAEQLEFAQWLLKQPDRLLQIQAASSPDEQLAISRNYFDEFKQLGDSRHP